jgi:hypothetical protein
MFFFKDKTNFSKIFIGKTASKIMRDFNEIQVEGRIFVFCNRKGLCRIPEQFDWENPNYFLNCKYKILLLVLFGKIWVSYVKNSNI